MGFRMVFFMKAIKRICLICGISEELLQYIDVVLEKYYTYICAKLYETSDTEGAYI